MENHVVNMALADKGRCWERLMSPVSAEEPAKGRDRSMGGWGQQGQLLSAEMRPGDALGIGHQSLVPSSRQELVKDKLGHQDPEKWQAQNRQCQILGGDGCWRFGSLKPGAICMFIIKLTLRIALNNSAVSVILLQCMSLGYKGKGAGLAQAHCCCLAL